LYGCVRIESLIEGKQIIQNTSIYTLVGHGIVRKKKRISDVQVEAVVLFVLFSLHQIKEFHATS